MESDIEFEVGPYRFSRHDARMTLSLADHLFDHYPDPAQPHLTERRQELQRLADAVGGAGDETDDAALAAALERGVEIILGARRALADSGTLPATADGLVDQLNVSDGGVPKTSVEEVMVDFGGIVGDRQATRRHHGRPWQALCLWSAEIIERLRQEGHPIEAGSAGENITISGLDWSALVPGARLRVGSTLVQISAPAPPCARNRRWFHDGDVSRISEHGPNSRLYATVIEAGRISRGDPVVLEPET